MLFIVRVLMFEVVSRCLLPVCCLLFVAWCLLLGAGSLLVVGCWFVVRVWFIGCCLLLSVSFLFVSFV